MRSSVTLSYENNVSCGIGTAKVTAVGTGNYTGSVFKKYTILPEKQAAAAAGSICRGAAARLILLDGGEERLEPSWIVTLDGRNLWTQED